MKSLIPAICLSLLLGIGAAVAETKTSEQKSGEAKPRTAKSIECSKQADAKGLHGKERQKFRSKCKKGDS